MENPNKLEDNIIFPINEMIIAHHDINKKMQDGERLDLSKIPITQIIRPGFDKCKKCKACIYEQFHTGQYVCSIKKEQIDENILICKFDGELYSKVLYNDSDILQFDQKLGDNPMNRHATDLLYKITNYMIDNYAGIIRDDTKIKVIKLRMEDIGAGNKIKNLNKILKDSSTIRLPIYIDDNIYQERACTGLKINCVRDPKYYDLLTIPRKTIIGYVDKIIGHKFTSVQISIPMKNYYILKNYLDDLVIHPCIKYTNQYVDYNEGNTVFHATATDLEQYILTVRKLYNSNTQE